MNEISINERVLVFGGVIIKLLEILLNRKELINSA
jgi:hypothetical protein